MKYTNNGPLCPGYTKMISATENPEMMGLDFGVQKMARDEQVNFCFDQEVVYDLLCGKISISWDGSGCAEVVERTDCFHEGAIVLHVPADTPVEITCLSDTAEIAIARTANAHRFAPQLMRPEDCMCANEERGAGLMGETSTRLVRTFFDRSTCPETNFFIGEVVHYQASGRPIRRTPMSNRRCTTISSCPRTATAWPSLATTPTRSRTTT